MGFSVCMISPLSSLFSRLTKRWWSGSAYPHVCFFVTLSSLPSPAQEAPAQLWLCRCGRRGVHGQVHGSPRCRRIFLPKGLRQPRLQQRSLATPPRLKISPLHGLARCRERGHRQIVRGRDIPLQTGHEARSQSMRGRAHRCWVLPDRVVGARTAPCVGHQHPRSVPANKSREGWPKSGGVLVLITGDLTVIDRQRGCL